MADETDKRPETRVGGGGGGKNQGLPLGEATPELRKMWKDDLEKSGKYTAGASLKELINKRDGGTAKVEDN